MDAGGERFYAAVCDVIESRGDLPQLSRQFSKLSSDEARVALVLAQPAVRATLDSLLPAATTAVKSTDRATALRREGNRSGVGLLSPTLRI